MRAEIFDFGLQTAAAGLIRTGEDELGQEEVSLANMAGFRSEPVTFRIPERYVPIHRVPHASAEPAGLLER